jgi:hypothetical protein
MTTTSIQQLAEEAYKYFVKGTRENGDKYWFPGDDRPEWIQDMCRHAHGDMLPDDHKYEFLVEALSALCDHDGDVDDAKDSIESDVYYAAVNAWHASCLGRSAYCDEYAEVMGQPKTTDELLSGGQWMEKCEVFDLVVQFLSDRVEE